MPARQAAMHIAEVALRVRDLEASLAFYHEVLGFQIARQDTGVAFLKVAKLDSPLGHHTHPQLFVLFDRQVALDPERTTLDHIAFEVAIADFGSERQRIEALGLRTREREFPWMRGRAFFFHDPDGNTIEFIAFDPAIEDTGEIGRDPAPRR